MNKKRLIAVGVLIAALGFYAVKRSGLIAGRGRVELDSGHRLVMGSFARVIAVAADSGTAKKCIQAAFEQFESVDNSMSDYKADSELSRVNRKAYENDVKISEELFEVLQKSVMLSRQTNGAFDITVGPLVDLLHSAEKKAVAPSQEQIEQAKLRVGFDKLRLDEQKRTVRFGVGGMRLDLGGVAKGYAIDRAVAAMQNGGATGGMVDIGGDIRCFGAPPPGKEDWLIGLQDPSEADDLDISGAVLLKLKLMDAAVATSGDYRRFALIEGKKYSHIINTGSSRSSSGLASVTIISQRDALEADALATAVSVLGVEDGLLLVESRPQTEAILISTEPEYKLIKSSGADKYLR